MKIASPGISENFILEKTLHELSLTQNLIELAEEHARRAGASAIKSITMKIGALSGVIPEAMEFAFEACCPGTLAHEATLEILHVPAIGRCRQCTMESSMTSLIDSCPECGGFVLDILQGQEMALTELEID
jgi:hydrogenase nickel incorporation protein HypA/HybF